MGENKDIITASFKVTGRDPSNDLVTFIERSFDFVLDAALSEGEKADGDYLVFVEIPRTEEFLEQLSTLVYGVSNLCEIDDWSFTYKKEGKKFPLSKITLKEKIPLTPIAYEQSLNEDNYISKLKSLAHIPSKSKWDFYDSVKSFKGK